MWALVPQSVRHNAVVCFFVLDGPQYHDRQSLLSAVLTYTGMARWNVIRSSARLG
jgi:hypothetical protein